MALDEDDRQYVLDAAVDILRHRQRARLLAILRDRLEAGDYPDERERRLDEIVLALACAIDEKLSEHGG
jgi:hypothetical protein